MVKHGSLVNLPGVKVISCHGALVKAKANLNVR
jgi:hypothetical protein